MKELKKFQFHLKEENTFPLDEQREYYLEPSREIFKEFPSIAKEIIDDSSALMAVVNQQVKLNNHSIRQIHLDNLAMQVAMMTPKEVINYQNIQGNSIIHITTEMMCYSVSILDMFKEQGADFSLINRKGETALIKIADTTSLDDLKFIHGFTNQRLLNHREIIMGESALLRAVKARRILNIHFLLEQGASLYVKDNNGYSVLDHIKEEDYKMKSERNFYKKLEEFVEIFKNK